MAQRCELCGKGPSYGNVISHANNTGGGAGIPNLQRVRALVNGARKQIRVCTDCIRSGRVTKATVSASPHRAAAAVKKAS